MKYGIRFLTNADAAEASLVVQESFLALAAADWQPDARKSFLEVTAPASLQHKLSAMTFAACALNATPYAIPFYKSVGFAPISSEFERDGQRAVRMACWLPARALGAELGEGQN